MWSFFITNYLTFFRYRPAYLIILLLIYFELDAGYCMYIVLIEMMFGVALPVMVFITLRQELSLLLAAQRSIMNAALSRGHFTWVPPTDPSPA